MPKLTQCTFFDGSEEKIDRLGLRSIWEELECLLTGFEIRVAERHNTNAGTAVEKLFHDRFRAVHRWQGKQAGGIDWTRCHKLNGTRVCLGVEIQFSVSAQSDLLFIDLQYLCDEITAGRIDVGVIVVPSDKLADLLTNRVARYTDALRAVQRASISDLPLAVLALEHDGPGPSLKKRQTRQGKKAAS